MAINFDHQTNTISPSSGIITISGFALPEIVTPINVSPADGTTNVTNTPTLTGSTFNDLNGYPMTHSQWQVSTVSDFSTTVVNTGDVVGTSISYSVPSNLITSTSTVHYWRVRYKSSTGVYSGWSTATSFTTQASFPPSIIGQAYGGGYYAGKINVSGTQYRLIVSPKSSGEASGKTWGDLSTTTNLTSDINGPTNSASLAAYGASYQAAIFCEGLTIGGYTDWYMPAKNELEVLYYFLKPSTGTNDTTSGANANAVSPEPVSTNYTSSSPSQTSAGIGFRTGETNAFALDYYWAATENGTYYAWVQSFNNANQSTLMKHNGAYVRAVRRVAV